MAIIKQSEYKTMTLKSMEERLAELRKELLKLNAQIAIGTTPENSGKIKEIKIAISNDNRLHLSCGAISLQTKTFGHRCFDQCYF